MGTVLVYVETSDGKIAPITFELLGAARKLGGEVEALLAGDADASQLGGADTVIRVEHPALTPYVPEAHVAVLAEAIRQRKPQAVLVGNTSVGIDLAAGAAAATDMPLVSYCVGLDAEGGAVVGHSQLYGGKIIATTKTDVPAIFAVVAGSFPEAPGKSGGKRQQVSMAAPASLGSLRTRFVSASAPSGEGVDITKAEKLVSVGRGIGGPENLELAEELAKALGAEVGASRPVCDSGWLPKARQVGKSGMTVKPKLYFAVGISGAPEHLEGMRDADLIVAVNSDGNAPIFKVAHYGTTCDLFDLLPALTERLKAKAG
ncbi:MAG TPA: electron transfer flavoprotein subunit alpha/FixB family protein [Candidatus Dormibacteraeota bacterium]|nr:electron transfer flavoprotein subunit alpha/FixB family protein [Candidatus Dormibacteraeota bacterium]